MSEELKKRFTYHAPTEEQRLKYEAIRSEALRFAELLNQLCPASRELSVAQTNLQQTVMWANASIAINPQN